MCDDANFGPHQTELEHDDRLVWGMTRVHTPRIVLARDDMELLREEREVGVDTVDWVT
jgi:hypothetical protein